jgi:hypothetical protein
MNVDNTIYGFTYRDCDGKQYKQEVTVDEVTWPEVLNDFVSFIEGIYGYDIKSSIRIKEPKYCLNEQAWHGEYFTKDED